MPDAAPRPFAVLSRCLTGGILLGGFLLAGCKLVDQRSFDRSAGRAPVPPVQKQVAHAVVPIPPLLVVHAGQADEDWQPDLRQAVAEALARKPNVLFTVESVAPAAASPAAQAALMRTATTLDGVPVAQAIATDGAQPAQVEMTAMSDPAAHAPEVRVYVH